MNDSVYVATSSGLVFCERNDEGWHENRRALDGSRLTCVIAWGDIVIAGAQAGIWVSRDRGESWLSASDCIPTHSRHVRWLASNAGRPVRVFAGTEPAGIFMSDNGGETWQECREVAGLRDQFGWYLPYSPEAGCVRGFAFLGERGYAAVEQGGVLVTEDNGNTWRLASGSSGKTTFDNPRGNQIHPDVHSICVHPASARRVCAPTGGGLFCSYDGGDNWKSLYPCYCRAAWLDPEDPNHIVFGPADWVDRGGRIEQSHDGGKTWQPANQGLSAPWPHTMVERFLQVGHELLAVLSNGELYAAPSATLTWRPVLVDVRMVRAAAVTAEPSSRRP